MMVRGALLVLPALSLAACQVVTPPPAAITVAPASAVIAAPTAFEKPVAVTRTTIERLTFRLDPDQSSGHIRTTIDPHGLGPRTAECLCPLRGTVTGELTSRPDGSRSLALDRIELVTTSDGLLEYDWSPLIGKIQTTIPAGELKISRNTIPGPLAIDSSGEFQKSGYKFTVDGIAKVAARGLLLKRRVGLQEADLSIDQTDAVHLVGSLLRRDGAWVLHVPAAILRDRIDVDEDGSTLELNFTARITAVAAP